jgi:hypothetical protein
MGHIKETNVEEYIKKYNLKNYIETGTGIGDCLEYIITNFTFSKYYTIEINEKICNSAIFRLQSKKIDLSKVNFVNSKSTPALEKILPDISGNTLFFLDAHFPGADFHLASYFDEKDENIRIPLKKEIETIVRLKNEFEKDVFVIDDLRIYEDGPFEGGNWPLRQQLGSEGIEFVYDLLSNTHEVIKNYKSQGYIIALPKDEK